jgi:energy-coupling factor transporter ATP-binding protein EcfA2
MANTRGEISQQFVPSLPTQPKVESTTTPETTGTAEERAKQLFQLLLDKVELQIDIQRRATNLAQNVQFTDEEIQAEIERWQKAKLEMITKEAKDRIMKLQPDMMPGTDAVNAKIAEMTAQAAPEPTADDMRAAAMVRLRQKKITELKTFAYDPLQSASDSDQSTTPAAALPAEAISHKLSMAQLTSQLTLTPVPEATAAPDAHNDPILVENRRQLAEIDQQVKTLMADQPVMDQYRQMSAQKLAVLRQAREAAYGQKVLQDVAIVQEQLTRQAYLEKRTFSPGEEAVIKRNQTVAAAITERVADLSSNPEVFIMMRWRQLKEYQVGLKREHFAETPSRQALMDQVRWVWGIGQRVLATGPTGSGKTELLLHAATALIGKRPEHASGYSQFTAYDAYGRDAGRGFEPGPLLRAIINRTPFILDEINVIPNDILMRMKLDLNAKAGDEVTVQEEGGTKYPVQEGLIIGATANIKSEKHPERIKLDPALVRMFTPLPVEYLPQEELHDIMMASLMDERGGIQFSSHDDLDALANLCQATAWIQRAYEGYEVDLGNGQMLWDRDGESTRKIATLREAVLDPGAALQMIAGWDTARLRDQTLREHINEAIITFVKNENYPPEDRYHLVRIFALNGFLQGVKAEDLGLTGVDQKTLDSWNGFQGQRFARKNLYLSPEQVAANDPFNVLRLPDGAAVDDLLGEDEMEQFAAEAGKSSAAVFAPGKRINQPNKLSAPAAGALQIIEQQYPETTYGNLDSKARFGAIPKKLMQALLLHPELLATVVAKMNNLIITQPIEERKGSAIPTEMSNMIQALRELIDKVTQAQNRPLLLQLGNMLLELNHGWSEYEKMTKPNWSTTYSLDGFKVKFDLVINELSDYVQKKNGEIPA